MLQLVYSYGELRIFVALYEYIRLWPTMVAECHRDHSANATSYHLSYHMRLYSQFYYIMAVYPLNIWLHRKRNRVDSDIYVAVRTLQYVLKVHKNQN